MATGTGNLPHPGMVATPFDIYTAEEVNQHTANIESLADGSGIGDGAITASKLDWASLGIWQELGRATASTNTTKLDVSFPAHKHLKVVALWAHNGSSAADQVTFNNRSGASDYSRSLSYPDAGTMKYIGTDASGIALYNASGVRSQIIYEGLGKSPASGINLYGSVIAVSDAEVRTGMVGTKQAVDITSAQLSSSITNGLGAGAELIVYGHN